MNTVESFIIGVIQGFTEFLPVSSSGHLVLFQKFFGNPTHDVVFDVLVHLATLLVILLLFRKTLVEVFTQGKKGLRFLSLVVAGTVPTAIIGITLKDFFAGLFQSLNAVGIAFLFTGVVLFLTKKLKSSGKPTSFKDLSGVLDDFAGYTYKKAILVGLAQGIAITPGVSRSGMTIAASLATGLSPRAAGLFSFALAVPAILGASVLMLRKDVILDGQALSYGAGFVGACVFGFVGLVLVLKSVEKQRLDYFSYYLWLLGISILLF